MKDSGIYPYKHFGKCLFATNGVIDIRVSCEFGIRVLSYSFHDEENVFFEQPSDMTDLTTPEGWRIYGGHRFWLSPESDHTYYPDNRPVGVEIRGKEILIRQEKDPWLDVIKEMRVILSEGTRVDVVHQVTNVSGKEKAWALWGICPMAAGGTERIGIPQPAWPYDPAVSVAVWPGTDIGDPRFRFGRETFELQQAPGKRPVKIGLTQTAGVQTYENRGVRFSLWSDRIPEMKYPDGGMCYETYICDHMLEMETLSPVYTLADGASAEHTEHWDLSRI